MNAYNSTPCTIAYDVGYETVSEIEVRSMELDGIEISQSSTRVYPQGSTASHVLSLIHIYGGYIEGIFVSGDAQSRGIGRQLMEHAKRIRGQLSLNAYQKNESAIHFYVPFLILRPPCFDHLISFPCICLLYTSEMYSDRTPLRVRISTRRLVTA